TSMPPTGVAAGSAGGSSGRLLTSAGTPAARSSTSREGRTKRGGMWRCPRWPGSFAGELQVVHAESAHGRRREGGPEVEGHGRQVGQVQAVAAVDQIVGTEADGRELVAPARADAAARALVRLLDAAAPRADVDAAGVARGVAQLDHEG